MEAELQFSILPNTSGEQLLDQIIKTIGLRELWYFGLLYVDAKDNLCWLELRKRVNQIKVRDKKQLEFQFLVRYYPEDIGEELIQDVTVKLFYLQVRESLLRSEIFCPPETALLLASYACQVKFGDYDSHQSRFSEGILQDERLLPRRIRSQYNWSDRQWENKLIKWYSEHTGLMREEAMLEYLRIAQDLEMYGVSYFEIRNKRFSRLYLGVDALGLNIYKHEDKLTPHVGFPWSEIRNISFKEKKFTIKSIDKKAPDFVFFVDKQRVNKNILLLCSGNHELFVRRRKEDPIEVQQMKVQAHEDKLIRKMERDRLERESQARAKAEQKLAQLTVEFEKQNHFSQTRVRSLESSYRSSLAALNEELQLESLQRRELESRQQKLLEESHFLDEKQIELTSGLCDSSLNLPLSPHVDTPEDEPDLGHQGSDSRGCNANRDRASLPDLSHRDEDLITDPSSVLQTMHNQSPPLLPLPTNDGGYSASSADSLDAQLDSISEHRDLLVVENGDNRCPGLSSISAEGATPGISEETAIFPRSEPTTTGTKDEPTSTEAAAAPVVHLPSKRHSFLDNRTNLRNKLRDLEEELKKVRATDQVLAPLEAIHAQNSQSHEMSGGLTKFQTLRKIRQGNTKRRIDEFESL